MKNRTKYYITIILIILFLIIVYSSIFMLLSLRIKGKSTIDISYNEVYKDEGASCSFFFVNLDSEIKTKSNLDVTKIGKYEIKYTVNVLFFQIERKRIINVVDDIQPIIEFKSEKSPIICPGSELGEPFIAYDEYDGNLTDKVKIERDDNVLTYSVTDSSGNYIEEKKEYKVEDKKAPELALKGDTEVRVKHGEKYVDAGYTATDNCSKKVNVTTKGEVDTKVDGEYKIEYSATDESNNKIILYRKVIVYTPDPEEEKKEPIKNNNYKDNKGVIFLTFDDGPSGKGSTAKILDILKDEGVKATFFVTGGGPDSLIKREYSEGHKLALHTNTHKYSYIYASVDNYFSDLNKVKNRVYNLTGFTATITRFPGGSNNRVSKSGIMQTLRKEVVNRGYSYFDWNVSADDAAGCTTADCVYKHTIKDLSKKRANIVLMHDIKNHTAAALRKIIKYAKSNGYEFKVIDDDTKPVRFK